MRTLSFSALVVLAIAAGMSAQSGFTNYESALVHPIRLSPDGSRLFVVNTANAHLEVYSLLNPDQPLLLRQIPVGLEPVSCTPRSNDEVWVVNNLSDSVSIVSVNAGRITATIRVKDEPCDVVFAGSPSRAFVSASASDQVRVFDPVTLAQVGSIDIVGKDPRALVADPTGTKVYAVVHRSGNGTTIVRAAQAPAPPPPTNLALPVAPQTGLIVQANSPTWAGVINFTLPDNDVAEIDATSLTVTRNFTGVGTILYDAAVDPATGDLFVANTNARNLVRFEPALRGHAIDSRVTRITTGATPVVTANDLNAGLNYSLLPNFAALATALSEPVSIVVGNGLIYLAAQGTDRIAVMTPAGAVQTRIDLGSTSTLTKRGPRGLALRTATNRLYVLNRMSATIATIDIAANAVVSEIPLAFDPTPASIKDGRKFLYDAKLSGNGTMSCASCHIDGDIDLMAWDLGDPSGNLDPTPSQPFPFNQFLPPSFHPMKGPMTTQTLRGLNGIAPLHWRGDRANLAAFNPAFVSLMGGSQLNAADMALFSGFMASIAFPPNPNQLNDRTLATTPVANNANEGLNVFQNTTVPGFVTGQALSCTTCHALPIGTTNFVLSGTILQQSQPMKAPHLRNMYRKVGASSTGVAKSGFGFFHDGSLATIAEFLALPIFVNWPANKKDDLESFVLAFDTGTAPAVGYQVTLDASNAGNATVLADIAFLENQAFLVGCDLIVKGTINGIPRSFIYNPSGAFYLPDDFTIGTFQSAALIGLAAAGQAVLTFEGVTPGDGTRLGFDHDLDGLENGADGLVIYGSTMTTSGGRLFYSGNKEPRVGDLGFALVASGVSIASPGAFVLSPIPAVIPIAGITVYVDYTVPGFTTIPVQADFSNIAAFPVPLPPLPFLAGYTIFSQAIFFDPGLPGQYAGSNGLQLTIQP